MMTRKATCAALRFAILKHVRSKTMNQSVDQMFAVVLTESKLLETASTMAMKPAPLVPVLTI